MSSGGQVQFIQLCCEEFKNKQFNLFKFCGNIFGNPQYALPKNVD